LIPSEREAHWCISLRFAIEAETADEASTVLTHVLQLLDPPLPFRSQPVIHPRHSQHRDGMWIADTAPDLTHLQSIEPDDAKTRCRWVETHFPTGVNWSLPHNTDRLARYEWPLDIWQRREEDNFLLHPSLRAVQIFCEAISHPKE
jgi:hypothetical protein